MKKKRGWPPKTRRGECEICGRIDMLRRISEDGSIEKAKWVCTNPYMVEGKPKESCLEIHLDRSFNWEKVKEVNKP